MSALSKDTTTAEETHCSRASADAFERYVTRLHELQTETKRKMSPSGTYTLDEPWWTRDNCLFWTLMLYKAELGYRSVRQEQKDHVSMWTAEWLGVGTDYEGR